MGYQDNYVGLRPGRSVEKLRSDSGMPSNLGTAQTGRGFRTSGAISPLWGNQVPKNTEAKAEDGAKALSTYYAPQMPSFNIPKAPGFGEQLAMNVGGKVVTDLAGKGLSKFFAPGSESQYELPSSGSSLEGVQAPPSVEYGAGLGDFGTSYDLGDTLNWETQSYSLAAPAIASWAEPTYSLAGATGASSVSGLSVPEGFSGYGSQFADVGADLATGGAEAAGGFSSALPYAPAALSLARGDVGGAAKSAAGTAIGNAIVPGIGGAVGAVLGGKVICTEMFIRSDISLNDLIIELDYARTLSDATLAGYRYWAVPVVRIMRRNENVYKFVKPIAKRFMKECAARIGHGKQSLVGRFLVPVGLAFCWLIGQFVSDTEYKFLFVKE